MWAQRIALDALGAQCEDAKFPPSDENCTHSWTKDEQRTGIPDNVSGMALSR